MTHRAIAVAILAVLVCTILFLALAACGQSGFQPASEAPPVAVQPADLAPPEPPVGEPVSVAIPKLGVTDEIVPVGLAQDNEMELPPVTAVGYYKYAPLPGQRGPAILAGHVDWAGVPGAFKRLVELKPGDQVSVTDSQGTVRRFAVYDVRTILKADYQTRTVPWVFGARTTTDLIMITCGGDLSGHQYTSNVVVSTRLAT